jgi:hypothetical protein
LSERFNRILGEKTRALLKERKLERSLWEDAMKIIVYVQNRILNDDQLKTPFELMNGFEPNLSNLRIFGVPAFVYNFDPLRRKLDDKATEGIFIGYDDTSVYSACYKIYSRKLRKVMRSIFVIFNESGEVRVDPNDLGQVEALLCDFDVVPEVDVIDSDGQESSRPLPSSSIPSSGSSSSSTHDFIVQESSRPLPSTTIPSSPTSGSDSRSSPTHDSSPILPLDVEPRLRARPRVNYKSLNRFGTVLNVSLVENIVEPTTVREALETDLSDLWEEAMKKELESIYKHETWEGCVTLYEDNTSTINIANNPVSHPNTKQIEIRHHLLRDGIRLKEIKIEKIPTTLQLGDVLTKNLDGKKLGSLTSLFMDELI